MSRPPDRPHPTTPEPPADRLRQLAARVRRLDGFRRDPEAIVVERHTIASELLQLARMLEAAT